MKINRVVIAMLFGWVLWGADAEKHTPIPVDPQIEHAFIYEDNILSKMQSQTIVQAKKAEAARAAIEIFCTEKVGKGSRVVEENTHLMCTPLPPTPSDKEKK
jgi:hypothetical protein